MSKNNTLADTAVSLVNSTKDENFKDIIRYKAIAALLVKLTIPEFKDKTYPGDEFPEFEENMTLAIQGLPAHTNGQ